MASSVSQQTFEVSTLPATAVTIYADRAEVKRQLKATLKDGANEIIVKKLTSSIDTESIRVEGHGKATLVEVQYQEKHVKKEEELREEQKVLKSKLDKAREERKQVENEEKRIRKQRELLDGLAEKLGRGGSASPQGKPAEDGLVFCEITEAHLQGLDNFMNYFVTRSSKLDELLVHVQKKGHDLDEEIRVLDNNFHESKYGGLNETSLSREVSILLDAQEAEPIELDVSYIVWNASWRPSYDLRVYSADRDMKIFYYGLVQQNTGEAWNDVKLSLSTATPSVGGQIPELGTLKVGFYKPPPPPPVRPMMKAMAMPCSTGATLFGGEGGSALYSNAVQETQMESITVAALNVQESVISTSFEIPRPTTVPSDNASHKVTVTLIDLKPDFEYETVPCKSPLAYLKARVKNTSQYPLLPGPTSVFLDNNFVAKGQLKAVSPQEEFSCSLGVDPAIRVEYKPARKFHEETGLLSKSSLTTHEQKINVKNTRGDAIKITVVDHLPLSTEEKVKVHLLEPQFRENTKYIRINKHNNLEWVVPLNAGEAKDIIVKYQVEHPRSEQLDYQEDAA